MRYNIEVTRYGKKYIAAVPGQPPFSYTREEAERAVEKLQDNGEAVTYAIVPESPAETCAQAHERGAHDWPT